MTAIAAPHCDCPDCRAKHWDDEPTPTYSSHEVIDAWQAGHQAGVSTTVRRLVRTLEDWLKSDPCEPVADEGTSEEPDADS